MGKKERGAYTLHTPIKNLTNSGFSGKKLSQAEGHPK